MNRFLLLATLISMLTSCGGVTRYYHRDISTSSRTPEGTLATVTIRAGQEVKFLKHSRGLMWGGYIEGLAIEDPNIVSLQYGNKGQNGDPFTPLLSIKGLQPGTTRAAYTNRMGEQPNFHQDLPEYFKRSSFKIIVR